MSEQIPKRKPEYAGLFYPSDAKELRRQIELASMENGTMGPDYSQLPLRALIVPSAGFSYSSLTALSAYELLRHRHYKKVIILGSSHFFSFSGVALTAAPGFETVFGLLKIDQQANQRLAQHLGFQFFENAFAKEYSIEIQLPYLHYFLEKFEVVPLILGNHLDIAGVATALSNLMDNNTLLVLSTNLSHFHSAEKARIVDRRTIDLLLAKEEKSLLENGEASALSGLAVLNRIATIDNWQAVFLDYRDSSLAGDDRESVVGFASLFYFQQ